MKIRSILLAGIILTASAAPAKTHETVPVLCESRLAQLDFVAEDIRLSFFVVDLNALYQGDHEALISDALSKLEEVMTTARSVLWSCMLETDPD